MSDKIASAFRLSYAVKASIAASPAVIWKKLTDAAAFPSWNSTVTRIDGDIALGSKLTIRVPIAKDRAFTPKVVELVPEQRMVWSDGFYPMFRGTRTFTLTPRGSATEFEMVEVFEGIMLPMIKGSLPDFGPVFDQYAADLKNACEGRDRAMPSKLARISRSLSRACDELHFGAPVTHVYDPLSYARAPHERYLERWGTSPKDIVFLGMNPGPFGMAQTGVPFGEVSMVRDFLGVTGVVTKPKREHPARPIEGFDCPRSEVSGTRVWGWVKRRFGTPEAFFQRFFVVNYCPLVFMEKSGLNRTPDKLPASEKAPLFHACDTALRTIIDELSPRLVIGVGAFAEGRAKAALADYDVRIGTILHPSPASPRANRGWAEAAEADLARLGVTLP